MINQYEVVFIMTPVLSDEQMKETAKKFKDLLLENRVEIVNEENWGLRKLAYPIQKKSTGFYYLLEFKSEGEVINTLEVNFRRDERIIRFLTVKLDKHAIAYSEKRRSFKKNHAATPILETPVIEKTVVINTGDANNNEE